MCCCDNFKGKQTVIIILCRLSARVACNNFVRIWLCIICDMRTPLNNTNQINGIWLERNRLHQIAMCLNIHTLKLFSSLLFTSRLFSPLLVAFVLYVFFFFFDFFLIYCRVSRCRLSLFKNIQSKTFLHYTLFGLKWFYSPCYTFLEFSLLIAYKFFSYFIHNLCPKNEFNT